MAGKRADLLLACMLGNRWRASNITSAASCSAASPIAGANSRVHLETLYLTVKNDSVSTGLFHTVQAQIRGSLGNTVLWGADLLVASSSSAQVSASNLAFATPKLGTGVVVAFNTAAGSVSYCINATGWIEDTNG